MTIQDRIQARYSVRIYQKGPIAQETLAALQASLEALKTGPFDSTLRFSLAAATEQDRSSLRGLGTYGFIKDPTGFIIGAVQAGDYALEDYGYAMEKAVLEATALGLGTCWLGGSFTQSGFAAKIGKRDAEIIPAVTSIGYATPDSRARDHSRQNVGADQRFPWEMLFFDGSFEKPLSPASNTAGYAQALEMVRLGPSAKNKQPWRIIKAGSAWHFYCQRTPGYGKGNWYFTLLRLADLQRMDIGIAMCHFELTARELGLNGTWTASDPGLVPVNEKTLYIATWEGAA
jgi:nitroreductase